MSVLLPCGHVIYPTFVKGERRVTCEECGEAAVVKAQEIMVVEHTAERCLGSDAA